MITEITKLSPTSLWENFYELTNIPRPSKKEQKIIQFLMGFGKSLNLETVVDEVGNVIICKPATPGMGNMKTVILQGHLDMVPQKNSDKTHDFEKDPIHAIIDGEWVRADGTTLGADNGMGVAAIMAILESTDIPHGPIEALFTVDEETGMKGAFGLKAGLLRGDILMNLDSEDEGELYIGCAGGSDANITFNFKRQRVFGDFASFQIKIAGLKGGHSGVDIHLGRGNANKIMNRILLEGRNKCGMHLVSIDGGGLRNAIPRESCANVMVPTENSQMLLDAVNVLTAKIKMELSAVEPGLVIEVVKGEVSDNVIDEMVFSKLLNAISVCPNGVIRMSNEMPGLVETSNNLARVKSGEDTIEVMCLLRSSVDSAKEDLEQMLRSGFELAGAQIAFGGQYPGWKPNPDSEILKIMQNIYKSLYGNEPEVKAIHAGLECGLLGGVYPEWDMISFGPTIRHPHSPDEKVHIPSVEKFWDFLLETLKNVPEECQTC